MAQSIFPTKPSVTDPDRDPRVVPLENADAVIEALASRTARRIVESVRDEPQTPSDISDSVETSIQNALYHLERLVDAGVLEIVDTCYSPRGREMSVYAPASEPIVICVGNGAVSADLTGTTGAQLQRPEFAGSD